MQIQETKLEMTVTYFYHSRTQFCIYDNMDANVQFQTWNLNM